MSEKEDRFFYVLYFACVLAHLINFAGVRLFPFVDIPNHLAMATIQKYYTAAGTEFSRYFVLNTFLKPNTCYMWFCSLGIFPSVETASRIFVYLYVLLYCFSIPLAVRQMRGNPWLSFLGLLFLYNYSLCYGFVGFFISIPIVIVVCTLMIADFTRPRPVLRVAVTLLLVLLFFMHALSTVFTLGFFVICCLIKRGESGRQKVARLLAAVPAAGLVLQWWVCESARYTGPGLLQSLINYYSSDYLQSFVLRLGLPVFDNYFLFQGLPRFLVGGLFAFTVIWVVGSLIWAPPGRLPGLMQRSGSCWWAAFLGWAILCYTVIPLVISGYSYLLQRFSVFIFLALILVGSAAGERRLGRWQTAIVLVAVILHWWCWYGYYREFNREARAFRSELFRGVDEGAIVGGLVYEPGFRGRPLYRHFLDYYIVWEKGVCLTRFIDDRSMPVQRNIAEAILPVYEEKMAPQRQYDGRYSCLDYLLVRGSVPAQDVRYFRHYDVMREVDMWRLYRRRDCCQGEQSADR